MTRILLGMIVLVALASTSTLAGAADEPKASPGPARFVDNGDGTATDTRTGLMWEIKVEGAGCTHCVEDAYTWTAGSNAPDGTAFTEFLDILNYRCGDEKKRCARSEDCTGIGDGLCGYAGYNDWRLPTENEMRAILLDEPCRRKPCVDPSFPGPVQPVGHWTSTAHPRRADLARGVSLGTAFAGEGPKTQRARVRAVRGQPKAK